MSQVSRPFSPNPVPNSRSFFLSPLPAHTPNFHIHTHTLPLPSSPPVQRSRFHFLSNPGTAGIDFLEIYIIMNLNIPCPFPFPFFPPALCYYPPFLPPPPGKSKSKPTTGITTQAQGPSPFRAQVNFLRHLHGGFLYQWHCPTTPPSYPVGSHAALT